jgi:hypothetical protein
MANKLKIAKTNGGSHDQFVSPTLVNGSHIGGTGGLTSQSGQQIQPQVFVTGGSQTTGSILAQKGAHKFKVTDGTRTGITTLVNSGSLSAGQMSIEVSASVITSATIATYTGGVPGFTYVTFTAGNVAGPVATPRVGDHLNGFSGNGTSVMVTGVVSAGNVQVSVVGNVTTQTGTLTDSFYANRISNKFVSDFNGVKFRYHLATPDATFVQVTSA